MKMLIPRTWAAQIEGNPVEMSVIRQRYNAIAQKYDYVTMEGSGGIICPIRYDGKKIMLDHNSKRGLGWEHLSLQRQGWERSMRYI